MNSARRRFLVTGATGFIGSRLARELVSEGADTHVLVRPSSSLEEIECVRGRLTVHVHDGTAEGLNDILIKAAPEVVFHLATLFVAQHENCQVGPLVDSNVRFSALLFEAMRQAGVRAIVNTGTSWEHFENRDYDPVSLYAATKYAAQNLLEYYVRAEGFRAISLKLYDIYGPRDPRRKLIALLTEIAESGATLAMSPGEQLIDMVHVDDVLRAFTVARDLVLQSAQATHRVYSVSSDAPLRLKDFVAVFERVRKTKCHVDWGGKPYRAREVMRPWNGGEGLPGWTAKISLEEGLKAL